MIQPKDIARGLVLSAALAVVLASGRAMALDRIDAPGVEKGEFEIEYSGSRTSDSDQEKDSLQDHELTLAYAPMNYWGMELTAHVSNESDEDPQLSGVEWLNNFQLSEPGEYWADIGATLSYTAATLDGVPDEAEARLLLEKEWGKTSHIANIGLTQEAGDDATNGPAPFLLWSSRCHLTEQFAPGFEIQSDFGALNKHQRFRRQEHYIGPAVYGSFGEHIEYEAAWLFGVTEESAHSAARLVLNYTGSF